PRDRRGIALRPRGVHRPAGWLAGGARQRRGGRRRCASRGRTTGAAPARRWRTRDPRAARGARGMNAAPPLQGLGVVITRPRAAADVLAAALEREGARAFVFPALAIEPLPPSAALDAALDALETTDLAIFVSANAVEMGLAAARARGHRPARVAAVGEATAQVLRNSGFAEV